MSYLPFIRMSRIDADCRFQTRSDILQGQALFRGVKLLLKKDGQKTKRQTEKNKKKKKKKKRKTVS